MGVDRETKWETSPEQWNQVGNDHSPEPPRRRPPTTPKKKKTLSLSLSLSCIRATRGRADRMINTHDDNIHVDVHLYIYL